MKVRLIGQEVFMEHISLLVHMMTLLTGLTASMLGFLLYLKYKVKVIKYYTFFLLSINTTVLLTAIDNYIAYNISGKVKILFDDFYLVVFQVCLILITYSFIRFSLYIIERPYGRTVRIMMGISIGVVIIGQFTSPDVAFGYLLMVLFISFVYYSFRIGKHYKYMDNLDLKRAIQTFATCFMIYIPLQVIAIAVLQNEMLIFLSRNVFYLMINVVSIVFAAKYFFIDTPGIIEAVHISDYFISKYGITPREKEIIALLMTGLSIKEIGGKIDRAFKTVNNHLYNIYRKTDVTSKMALLNIIRENQI